MARFWLSRRDLVPLLCVLLLIAGLGAAALIGLVVLPLPPLSMTALVP